jgi:hypothetical protein
MPKKTRFADTKDGWNHSKPLKPLSALMSVRRVQRCLMERLDKLICVTLPLSSEQDHAHHAMKTVTKDATVQQGGTHELGT